MPDPTHVRRSSAPLGRRQRSRSLAKLYAAGSVLALISAAAPQPQPGSRLAVLSIAAFTAVMAGTLTLCSGRIATGWYQAILVLSYLGIAAGQAASGGGSIAATFAMLYVWTALHASLFHSPRVIAAHLAATTTVHTTVLLWLGATPVDLLLVVITLVTQLATVLVVRRLIRDLHRHSQTDPLTGLGNRETLDRALRQAIAVSARDRSLPVCVAALDLNGFKAVNDAEGHLAGDRLLRDAAAAWSEALRDTDTLTRTGGDEFVVVLVGSDASAARNTVQRLIARTPQEVSCSAGIAQWNGYESSQLLVERADQALYRAKQDGPVHVGATTAPDHHATTAETEPHATT